LLTIRTDQPNQEYFPDRPALRKSYLPVSQPKLVFFNSFFLGSVPVPEQIPQTNKNFYIAPRFPRKKPVLSGATPPPRTIQKTKTNIEKT
jgi:hypothetical protein